MLVISAQKNNKFLKFSGYFPISQCGLQNDFTLETYLLYILKNVYVLAIAGCDHFSDKRHLPCFHVPYSVLVAKALFIYYTSVPTGTEVK